MHRICHQEVISAPGGLQEVSRLLPNRKLVRLQLLPEVDIQDNKQREVAHARIAEQAPCHVQRGHPQRHKVQEVAHSTCLRVP